MIWIGYNYKGGFGGGFAVMRAGLVRYYDIYLVLFISVVILALGLISFHQGRLYFVFFF